MPTYEYQCEQCGTVTDIFQSITDKPLRKFRKSDKPNCACNAPVTRLLGRGGGIIFRGSGFYETDYRSDSYKKAAKADSETSAGNSKADGNGKVDSNGKVTKKESDTKPSKSPASKKGE